MFWRIWSTPTNIPTLIEHGSQWVPVDGHAIWEYHHPLLQLRSCTIFVTSLRSFILVECPALWASGSEPTAIHGLLVTRSWDILALALSRHTTSKLVPSVPVSPKLHVALAACNNASCTLSVDELRNGGSPNRETQYSSQGLLVTRSLDI